MAAVPQILPRQGSLPLQPSYSMCQKGLQKSLLARFDCQSGFFFIKTTFLWCRCYDSAERSAACRASTSPPAAAWRERASAACVQQRPSTQQQLCPGRASGRARRVQPGTAESVANLERELFMVQREAQKWEGCTNGKGGYKCSDSHRAEVSDLDFPSKQGRQNSRMAIRKEQAAWLRDSASQGTATPIAHLLQTVQVAPGITDKPWHAQGCPATVMPCREWKRSATAAAACSFPLDATSLFGEQMPTAQGHSARATAALAAQRGRNGEQTAYCNHFRIAWQVFYQSIKLPLWLFHYCCGPTAAGECKQHSRSHTPCHSVPTLPQRRSLPCWCTRATNNSKKRPIFLTLSAFPK